MSHDLIIDTPSLQELKHRYGYRLATLVLWAVWLYLWLPLLSLFAWLAGTRLFYEHMIRLGGYQGLLAQLHWYVLCVTLIAVLWTWWVEFNRRRFRGYDRRNRVGQVSNLYDEAEFFDVDPELILEVRQARTIHVHFTDQLSDAQRRDPPQSTPWITHLLLPPGEDQGNDQGEDQGVTRTRQPGLRKPEPRVALPEPAAAGDC